MNPKSWRKSVRHSVPALIVVIAANWAVFLWPAYAQDAEESQGDERLACGAVLCLASGAGRGESECNEYLNKYFSIKFTRPDKTFEARRDFLNLCPTSHNVENNMPALVNAIARGAGNCDAAYLNNLNKAYYEKTTVDKGWNKWSRDDDTVRIERVEYVRNQLPGYCKVYDENEYTQGVIPIYIGIEKEDGHFIDPPIQ
ncbi:TrbM/KikA/MpfK family conjugal transfer protein [Advenella sp. FME57]|uniref:TrbM/KikA/MpfK family conjugal transfer protein n=1 Tax=Advenella sp. FME57 TaxID=2742604 RepID=UPI0018691C0F|nr:TrbM/KikA/MpfK family conjugal transfer protein [Advenella sp. FME57]